MSKLFPFPLRRRSVGKLMFIRRSLSFLFLLLLIAGLGNRAMAQTLKNFEGAVNIFGQFSGSTNGNGVKDSPTDSLGVLATVRQSFPSLVRLRGQLQLYPLYREVLHDSVRGAEQRARGLRRLSAARADHSLLGLQPFGAVGVGASSFYPPPWAAKNTTSRRAYRCFMRSVSTIRSSPPTWAAAAVSRSELQDAGLQCGATDYQHQAETSEPSVGAYLRF
jgi:hypothetical protein